MSEEQPKRRPGNRKGPDKRKRPLMTPCRVSAEEKLALRERAAQAGVSVSELLRHGGLNLPLPATRRPRVRTDLQPIAALLQTAGEISAEMGKQGSNLNQLAHQANADRLSRDFDYRLTEILTRIEASQSALLELAEACMKALGFDHEDD